MAKAKRTNSAVSAISGLVATIGKVAEIELAGNPEAIADVKQTTANLVDSNLTTAMEHLDDNIETAHQVDAVFEQAGIDPVEHRRAGAIEGAEIAIEMLPEQIEEVEEE
jgi:hypothetical protein